MTMNSKRLRRERALVVDESRTAINAALREDPRGTLDFLARHGIPAPVMDPPPIVLALLGRLK